jgi:hypothetical protein
VVDIVVIEPKARLRGTLNEELQRALERFKGTLNTRDQRKQIVAEIQRVVAEFLPPAEVPAMHVCVHRKDASRIVIVDDENLARMREQRGVREPYEWLLPEDLR